MFSSIIELRVLRGVLVTLLLLIACVLGDQFSTWHLNIDVSNTDLQSVGISVNTVVFS